MFFFLFFIFLFLFFFFFFFFNDTATTEIYTFPYTTLFRSPRRPGNGPVPHRRRLPERPADEDHHVRRHGRRDGPVGQGDRRGGGTCDRIAVVAVRRHSGRGRASGPPGDPVTRVQGRRESRQEGHGRSRRRGRTGCHPGAAGEAIARASSRAIGKAIPGTAADCRPGLEGAGSRARPGRLPQVRAAG